MRTMLLAMTGACAVLVARVVVHSPHGPFADESSKPSTLVASATDAADSDPFAKLASGIYGDLSEDERAAAAREQAARRSVFLPSKAVVTPSTRDRVPPPQRSTAGSTRRRSTASSSSSRSYSTYFKPFAADRRTTGASEFERMRIDRDRQQQRYRRAQDRRNQYGSRSR